MAAAIGELGAELEAPVLVCLEGGYSPRALAESVVATVRGLAGEVSVRHLPGAAAEPHLSRVAARGH
jgi:acetoin utilization deacetylase AcuC-like enzyme